MRTARPQKQPNVTQKDITEGIKRTSKRASQTCQRLARSPQIPQGTPTPPKGPPGSAQGHQKVSTRTPNGVQKGCKQSKYRPPGSPRVRSTMIHLGAQKLTEECSKPHCDPKNGKGATLRGPGSPTRPQPGHPRGMHGLPWGPRGSPKETRKQRNWDQPANKMWLTGVWEKCLRRVFQTTLQKP